MSLDDAVKAAVRSLPRDSKFADDPAPAMDEPGVDDSASPEADAPKEGTSKETPDGAPTAKSDDVTRPVEGSQAVPEAKASLDTPKNWPKDRRDQFAALPDDAKRIILDREKEINTGFTKNAQENADHRRRSEAVTNAFKPHHRQQMQQNGLDEVQAVRYLLDQNDAFNNDPVGFISNVAKSSGQPAQFIQAIIRQSGLTQDQLGFAPTQSQPDQTTSQDELWVDPQVKVLMQELGQTKQQVAQLLQTNSQREQDAARARQAEINRTHQKLDADLHDFVNAADENGNPQFPHVAAVEDVMALLIKGDPALQQMDYRQALEEAYSRAVYLNPEIRQQILESERSKWAADRDAENAAKAAASAVAKAKTAATVKGSPGANGGSVSTRKMNVNDAVTKAVREAYRNR